MMQYNSPLELISFHPGNQDNINLYVKRDDLLHPDIHGNKWRKLAPALPIIKKSYPAGVVTLGGAFSNHVQAVAAAGRIYGFPTHGIIRGLHADINNPTLSAARADGMQLHLVSKQLYAAIKQGDHKYLIDHFPSCYLLPEGGSSPMAVEHCSSIANEIRMQLAEKKSADKTTKYICVPAGTGCTAAGIVKGLKPENGEKVLVFPVVNTGFDHHSILNLLGKEGVGTEPMLNVAAQHFQIINDYEFGGFACYDEKLMEFIRYFEMQTGILPDPLYTAKMFFGVYDMLGKRVFAPKSTIVMMHTGGLQGWKGFKARYALEKEKK